MCPMDNVCVEDVSVWVENINAYGKWIRIFYGTTFRFSTASEHFEALSSMCQRIELNAMNAIANVHIEWLLEADTAVRGYY